MPREARTLLHDIRTANGLLISFTRGKSFQDYQDDALLRAAVERQFQIIGEAVSQLAKHSPDLAGRITGARRIVAFRNILVHAYAAVSDAVVWGLVEAGLPTLEKESSALLQEIEGE
ncbi:MAG: DUF86 domain-containing protein [bacterium]|nr:DUF86 domain-containing protein [bacterium]